MERILNPQAKALIDIASGKPNALFELTATAWPLSQCGLSPEEYELALKYRKHRIALAQGSLFAQIREKILPFN